MHYKRKECETKTREKNEWDAKAERGRTCLTLSKILEDVTGTFIDKTDGKDPKNRKLLDENFENSGTRWTQH